MPVLKQEVAAILRNRDEYTQADDYYEGNVPEVFATAKLRKAMRAVQDSGKLNYCRPVVDAVNNRMEISSITGTTKAATAKIEEVWVDNELDLEVKEIHRKALTFGDSFAMVWPDEEGKLQIAYNSPVTTALVYDPENPRKKLMGVKMWKQDEKTTRINVYTKDSVTKYQTASQTVTEKTNWEVIGTDENPFGEVPIFHFRTHRPFGRAEHKSGFDAQNAINKLFITNMYTVDYLGAPQRYALSQVGGGNEIEDFDENAPERENVAGLKSGPGELWYLNGVSQVGQFPAADSKNFWDPIMNIVRSLASLTDTPLHYFEKTQTPSGNALRVAEAPLLKKVSDREASFGATWREIFRFILKVEGIKADVQVFWKAIESLDELERWDLILKKINSGLSHRQALREGGYADDQIEKIMEERNLEAEAGSFYKRAPQTRVSTTNNDTLPLQADTTGN